MDGLRVVRARDRTAAVAVLRLALGLVAAAVALTRVDGDRAALGLALGTLGFGVLGTARQLELGRAAVSEGLPSGATIVGPLRPALAPLLPSTVGVFALALAAVALEPVLAPLLAGIVVGMAVATVASVGQIASNERLHRHRLYAAVDPPPRAYAVPEPHR